MDLKLHVIARSECVVVHTLNGAKISKMCGNWPLANDVYLKFQRSKWYITDNQSSEGVYHNGKKIKTLTSVTLRNGSSLCIGPPSDATMKYECFFVSPLRKTVYRSTKQNSANCGCSGANCSVKGPLSRKPESPDESQADPVSNTRNKDSKKPNPPVCESCRNVTSKEKDKKAAEKVQKSGAIAERKVRDSRKRKASTGSKHDGDRLIPHKKSLMEIEKYKNMCNKLKKQTTQFKRQIVDLKRYRSKVTKMNSVTLGKKIEENTSKVLENLLEEQFSCSICTEVFIKPVSLSCSHMFCEACLTKCQEENNTCPMCRTPITIPNKLPVVNEFLENAVDKTRPEFKRIRGKVIAEREAPRNSQQETSQQQSSSSRNSQEDSQQGTSQQPSSSSGGISPSDFVNIVLPFMISVFSTGDNSNHSNSSNSRSNNSDTNNSNDSNSNNSDTNNSNDSIRFNSDVNNESDSDN